MTTPASVERVDFAVMYDGPGLREHRMSVRDLAPALLGLADLLQEASAHLRPGEPQISLDIKATDEGSFLVELAVIHERVVHLLTAPDTQALAVLVGFVTGAKSVFNYFRNRHSGSTEEVLPNGSVRITLPDGTRLEFPAEVLSLSRQPGIRRGVQAVIAPLSREGIDRLEMRPEARADPTVVVTEADLPVIGAATAEDGRNLVTDQRYTATLTIMSPNFQAGKWRLSDGQGTYWMAIDDNSFLGRIDRHELRFGKDDRLRGEVWFRQWETDAGAIHGERSVTRVDDYLPAPQHVQTAMGDDNDA